MGRTLNKVVIGIICLMVLWIGIRTFVLSFYEAMSDKMEPTIQEGQHLLVMKCGFSLAEKDIVIYKKGNKDYVRRIDKIKDNIVIVRGDKDDTLEAISKKDVKGKLIHIF